MPGKIAATKSSKKKPAATAGRIRVGIGGWSYEPWHTTFYPDKLPKSRALEYASRQVSAIEINSTFYGSQKPATFAKWHDTVPDDFVFSVKAPRGATHRSELGDAAASIERFLDSGIDRLGPKLGPLLWQFPATRSFEAEAFEKFLERLPAKLGTRPLRHVLDVRHPSFSDPAFIKMMRRHGAAIVYTDDHNEPAIPDITADFVYLRLREARATIKTGYPAAALKRWAAAVQAWSQGGLPSTMKPIGPLPAAGARSVYAYFINGAKERAPAAAIALQALL